VNKFITILSFSFAVPSFLSIFSLNKTIIVASSFLAFFLCLFFFWIDSMLKRKGSKIINAIFYFFTKIDDPYLILEQSYIYERIDAENWEFTKKYCLKSRSNTFDSYDDRFCWSGDSNSANIEALEPKQTVTNIRGETIWTAFTVKFNTVRKGKEVSTGAKITSLVDVTQTVRPFLSNTILRKTRLLRMTVKLPMKFKPINPKIEIHSNDTLSTRISSNPLKYNESTHEIELDPIEYPRKGWRYVIVWENPS